MPELKIHELRAETYNGMVRLLKPGCRTIVLIVDRESKEKLVPKFYKLAWPYRRNKTLMFGFLFIEKGKKNNLLMCVVIGLTYLLSETAPPPQTLRPDN